MDETLKLEMCCRAICSMETLSYPATAAGKRRAEAYIEDRWLGVWAWMRVKSNWAGVWRVA